MEVSPPACPRGHPAPVADVAIVASVRRRQHRQTGQRGEHCCLLLPTGKPPVREKHGLHRSETALQRSSTLSGEKRHEGRTASTSSVRELHAVANKATLQFQQREMDG